MDGRIVHHEVLGRLEWDERLESWWGSVELVPGSDVSFAIHPETGNADAEPLGLFETGVRHLAWAREFEPRIREWAAGQVIEPCNVGRWLDGLPRMDLATLTSHLKPCAISVHQDGCASWGFSSGDLFGGQELWLTLGLNGEFTSKPSLLKWSPPSV